MLGIISTLLVKIGILDTYYRPVLEIGEDEPVKNGLEDNNDKTSNLPAHRIVVRNSRRTAAKDCKAYIKREVRLKYNERLG